MHPDFVQQYCRIGLRSHPHGRSKLKDLPESVNTMLCPGSSDGGRASHVVDYVEAGVRDLEEPAYQ